MKDEAVGGGEGSSLVKEFQSRAESAQERANRHRYLAKRYARLQYIVGIPAVALAAAAGVAASFSAEAWVTASIAFGSATLGGIERLVTPNGKQRGHKDQQRKYNELGRKAGTMELRLAEMGKEQQIDALERLDDLRSAIDANDQKAENGARERLGMLVVDRSTPASTPTSPGD